MNTSGEAADQVVRMSLEVGEAALKISGTGAQQLAVLLYAVLKEQKKTGGRARLETLVRSGKPLTVFSVKESDLKTFVKEAKQYGILYCAIRNKGGKSDGMVDIMVKEEDAPRINRIVERFQFASVGRTAEVQTEIQKDRGEAEQPEPAQTEEPDSGRLAAELLGISEEKEEKQQNPSLARTESSRLSEPISGRQGRTAEGIFDRPKPYRPVVPEKPSVRKAIREIQASGEQKADTAGQKTRTKENQTQRKSKNQDKNQDKALNHAGHRSPQVKRKSGKEKER